MASRVSLLGVRSQSSEILSSPRRSSLEKPCRANRINIASSVSFVGTIDLADSSVFSLPSVRFEFFGSYLAS